MASCKDWPLDESSYEVLRKIGRGAFSVVHYARCRYLDAENTQFAHGHHSYSVTLILRLDEHYPFVG